MIKRIVCHSETLSIKNNLASLYLGYIAEGMSTLVYFTQAFLEFNENPSSFVRDFQANGYVFETATFRVLHQK